MFVFERKNIRMLRRATLWYIFFDDCQASEKCLIFSLDRAPKVGTAYVISRNDQADIILTDPENSGRRCSITIASFE